MRAVVQRVSRAHVEVDGGVVGEIGPGLLLLVGVAATDSLADAEVCVRKVAEMRIFPDGDGNMNRSVEDVGGSVLVVSQFTLLADIRRGRRPSFTAAAQPVVAEPLVDAIRSGLDARGIRTAAGSFGARMQVKLVNDGPVTIVIDVEGGQVTR